jgi:hypothetical protein
MYEIIAAQGKPTYQSYRFIHLPLVAIGAIS